MKGMYFTVRRGREFLADNHLAQIRYITEMNWRTGLVSWVLE